MRLMVGEFLFFKNKSWFIIKSLDWLILFYLFYFYYLIFLFVINVRIGEKSNLIYWMYFEKIII